MTWMSPTLSAQAIAIGAVLDNSPNRAKLLPPMLQNFASEACRLQRAADFLAFSGGEFPIESSPLIVPTK
jgi:hypothetical protein